MLREQAWCGEERRRDAEHKGSDAVLGDVFVARAAVDAKRESMTKYGGFPKEMYEIWRDAGPSRTISSLTARFRVVRLGGS